MFEGRPGHIKIAENICFECPFELLVGYILDRFLMVLIGRVIDQDIEPAEQIHSFVDSHFAEFGCPNVARNEMALSSFFFHVAGRFSRIGFFHRKINDSNIGALAGEQNRHRTADARVAAGY